MQHEFRFLGEVKICFCLAKLNVFQASGSSIGRHHHGDDQNKKQHGFLLGMRAVFVFGHHLECWRLQKRWVSLQPSNLARKLSNSAVRLNGRDSVNPLYPTYKN